MSLFPVSGATISIGNQFNDQSSDLVEGDFTGMTWLLIDGWSQMGSVGDSAQLISTDLINRGRTVKQKGTFNAGSMQNMFALISADVGQIALLAAAKVRNNYAFKLVFDDASTTSGAGSERKFIALVMNEEESGGDANTIQNLNITLELNSNIVHKAAT